MQKKGTNTKINLGSAASNVKKRLYTDERPLIQMSKDKKDTQERKCTGSNLEL